MFASNDRNATTAATLNVLIHHSSFFLHSNGPFRCPVDNEPFEKNEVHTIHFNKFYVQLHYLKILLLYIRKFGDNNGIK